MERMLSGVVGNGGGVCSSASTPTIPLERRAPEETGQRRGALVYHRSSSRRKLSVSWKPERDLVAVQYFEMDENERGE